MKLGSLRPIDDRKIVDRVLKGETEAFNLLVHQWEKPIYNFIVRLIGDREAIEKVATTWDRVVVDRSAELAETARVIRTLVGRVPVAVFVNNHYAGHAPSTVRDLRGLLGQPDPVPPERPRTTLFD